MCSPWPGILFLNIRMAHSQASFSPVIRYLIREVFSHHSFSWHLLLADMNSYVILDVYLPSLHEPHQHHFYQCLANRRHSFSHFIFIFPKGINNNWSFCIPFTNRKRETFPWSSCELGFEFGSNYKLHPFHYLVLILE